jgi:hypothetical protein
MSRSEPTEVTGLAGVIAVATGDSHVLALTADGTLWAWGANFDGELGTGASDGFSAVPVQVQGLSGAGEVKTIAAGGDHSLALTAAGQVYTWGANHDGQLGIEDSDQEDTPVPSTALTSVSAIAAGTYYSLAVTSGGDVYTWGENSLGQLGRVPTGWAATQRPASIAVGSRPGVPTEVEVTQGDSQATLTWTAPADDGGAAITGYKVSKDGGTTWETASGTYTHTFTGLTNGQEYDFQVRAVNRVGDGPEEEVSATPTGPPPATEHILMVQAGDGGTIVGPAPTQVVPAGDPVNLEAAANTGYHFAGWTSTNGGTFGDAASLETSFTMPDAATTVTANFAHDPVITVDPLDNETVQAGKSYVRSVLYTYEYGSGPVGFSATGLPSGLSIDQSGLISGAPLTPGTYPIEVTITDGTATGKGTFTLTVQAAPLPTVLELDPLDNGVTRVGVSYSKVPTCRYLNGSGTLVFGASGLPAGLSVNPDSGVISGTPTEPGTFAVTLTLTDGTLSVNRTFTLTVAALYQLTVEDGEGSGIYPPGAVVPISAEALSGRVFEAWTGGDGGTFADPTMAFTTFTMPPNAATITATYLPGPINPIGYAYPVLGHFGTWSGVGSVTATVDADHTQFARLTLGGSVVAPANYSIAGGSTKITLNSAYLSGLANGTYQFVAEYVAYPSGPIQLVVKRGGGGPADPGATDAPGAKSDGMPFTGTGLPAWVILLALALVGVGMRLTRVAYVKARSRT